MDTIYEINKLKEENEKLKLELEQTKEHLKKYTAPKSNKIYYEKHKEELKQKPKKPYIVSPEKKREYNLKFINKKKEEQHKEPENI